MILDKLLNGLYMECQELGGIFNIIAAIKINGIKRAIHYASSTTKTRAKEEINVFELFGSKILVVALSEKITDIRYEDSPGLAVIIGNKRHENEIGIIAQNIGF